MKQAWEVTAVKIPVPGPRILVPVNILRSPACVLLTGGTVRRRRLIAANWKMNLGRFDEALGFVRFVRSRLSHLEQIEVVLCPPFTVLAALAEVLRPSPITLGAQNMHWSEAGAHTGEISPGMLGGLCDYVIVGHSERRTTASAGESDAAVNRKVHAPFDADFTPTVCVGENLEQNESGETDRVVGDQVEAALGDLPAECVARSVVAYEPIWAIGSGRAATPSAANSIMALTIRGRAADIFGQETADSLRVLYGGSVTASNIAEFMAMPDIDGALVGGASLDADGFVDLVRNATGGVQSLKSKV